MKELNRREFLKATAIAGSGLAILGELPSKSPLYAAEPGSPIVVSSANGKAATARALEILRAGKDPLDAVIAGVNLVEDDPEDITVGYGGLPNEAGVVQLDASVMHGPTHNAGAVACLEGIKNPSKVAKLVMERTDHVLLVGKGAQDFARAHGFKVEDLLTDKARRLWLKWKENLSDRDDWLSEENGEISEQFRIRQRLHGTINCCAVDTKGNLAGVTTTSGLAFKIPGRVGDSPIIGAGLYVDNKVGAAGSTGRGEANLKNLASFLVVEFMRQGKSPTDACLAVCKRIAENIKQKYLLRKAGEPNFNVSFYAVNKKGEAGGASILSGHKMWITDNQGQRLVDLPFLFESHKR